MDFWRSIIRRQFTAAMDMLGNAIEACPENVWFNPGPHPFWQLAFHTIFWLDLYLADVDEPHFQPPPPFTLTELDKDKSPERAYTKDELRTYLQHCRHRLNSVIAAMTETWVEHPCPIPYRAMSNGELLLYNMRHVQHHAAQLNLLLRQQTDSAPTWVSKGRPSIGT